MPFEPAPALREARRAAGLTQDELAEACNTSQATVSAYESGRKQPSVETLNRLMSAAGSRLRVEPGRQRLVVPSRQRHARTGLALVEVLALAQVLPTRHDPVLRFPRLR